MNYKSACSNLAVRVHIIFALMHPGWSLPLASTASGIRFDFLSNVSDNEEQMKQKLQEGKKAKEAANEGLQVLDQLILDEAGGLLSSYASIPETSPTTEDFVAGQVNTGRVELEEVSPVSKDVDHMGSSLGDAELMQFHRKLPIPDVSAGKHHGGSSSSVLLRSFLQGAGQDEDVRSIPVPLPQQDGGHDQLRRLVPVERDGSMAYNPRHCQGTLMHSKRTIWQTIFYPD
ncbi:uncharacterized protein [Periplaneta americana]|uniref:uncharacterized protein isoform X2 n=1 Tax=Periplaneta americana TaxID=6978 RepID=UPI0037E7C4B1